MNTSKCPVCGSDKCRLEDSAEFMDYLYVGCQTLHARFFIHSEIINMDDKTKRDQVLNLIYQWILRRPYCVSFGKQLLWRFYYYENESENESTPPETKNMVKEIAQYPTKIVARVSQSLLNLSLTYPDYGKKMILPPLQTMTQRLLFCDTPNKDDEALRIIDFLTSLGYVKGSINEVTITFKGWEKIEELTKRLAEINQGFIAISYSPEAESILETIISAIGKTEYKHFVMREKEHNNQVVPEMFFEIERSKFMVVDVTYANYGAYYEAGYAEALGKEVIVCCNKKEVNSNKRRKRPHFDIAQKSMVVWETLDELKEKLITRIRATVH